MKKTENQLCKKLVLLFFCILFFVVLPVSVKAEESRTVRIGWFEDLYHIMKRMVLAHRRCVRVEAI